MKTLMNTALKTIMKSSLCALAALLLPVASAFADATFNGVTYVDLTTDGAGTASSTNAAYYGYSMPGCFDNSWADSADRGMCGYTTTYPAMYVDYAFNTATAVNAYSVRNAGNGGSNQTQRAPNTWIFEGSDDGTTWTMLDARSGEDNWANAEVRLYKFDNSHAYKHYRYSCTELNGSTDCFQVHEIEFYNTTAPLVTSSFLKKLVFTVAGHTGSEDLKHFPVLVRLSTAISGFDYADCGTGGAGIRFADADGNLLHHEIDTWNTAGESLVWVDLPHCNANETFTLYLAADDPAALQTVYPTEVWDNAAVPAVWHMNEVKADSSGNTYTYYNCGTLGTIATGGAVGNQYDGTSSGGWSIANNKVWSGYGAGGKVAYTAWVARDAADSGVERYVFSTDNISLTSTSTASSYTWKLLNGTTVLLTVTTDADLANWSQVAVVSGSGAIKLYFNGELAGTYAGNIPASPNAFRIAAKNTNGDYRWKGYLDEVRIHRAEESAEYVRASYATVTSAGFLTNTGVQSTGAVSPLVVRADEATLSGTTATITGRLSNLGTGATSADVTLYYGTSANVESGTVASTTNLTDKADLSDTLTGLTAGATYYYAYKAVNDAPTAETAWSATNSFVVEASTRFSDTMVIATNNCQMTVTGAISEWGLGTTVVELLVGTSADNLASVQTVNLSQRPANDQVVFDPVTMPVGTYVVAIRATTTYNDIVWVRETAATSQVLSDTSTYTWKGGKGDWADPAMWASSDTGAGGYPTAGCSVVFPAYAKIENVVSLSANPGTLAAITIDSASRYTFRSTSRSSVCTITAPTKTMTGAGGGTLVLDAVSIKGTEDKNRFDTLAGLKRLVLENSAEFAYPREADNSQLELSLVSSGKFSPYWTAVNVGKLRVGHSINYLAPAGSNGMTFDSFENIGSMGYCRITEGAVRFNDISGITQIGGEGTFESNTSQIKVAPEFTFYIDAWHQNKGIAAISNNVVVALSASTMLQGFDGATSLDNVYVDSATTLTENKTVNAVMLENDLDLGGHTLTVVSGVVRIGPNGNGTVKNGTLRVLRPLLAMDNTNNATERFTAEIETEGNDDPWTAMFDMWSLGGSKPKASFSNFVGRVIWPFNSFTFKSGRTATNYVVDVKSGSVGTGSHNEDYVVRGIAGNCELKTGMFNNTVWVGDCNDDQFAQMGANSIANWGYVVSTNGILAPGVLSWDGGRRGMMRMVSTKERMVNFLMDEGGTLQIAIHADGDNTYLKMSDIDTSYSWSTYISVTLAGTLDIREYGKIQTGVAYPVVFYHPGKRTGKFDRVTINGAAPPSGAGYVVKYDVPQPDGSYAVTVTKKGNAGTLIIIR